MLGYISNGISRIKGSKCGEMNGKRLLWDRRGLLLGDIRDRQKKRSSSVGTEEDILLWGQRKTFFCEDREKRTSFLATEGVLFRGDRKGLLLWAQKRSSSGGQKRPTSVADRQKKTFFCVDRRGLFRWPRRGLLWPEEVFRSQKRSSVARKGLLMLDTINFLLDIRSLLFDRRSLLLDRRNHL